jgi:hypothetical protein
MENTACKALIKLTGLYNKTLSPEQSSTWLSELIPLDEFIVQKVLFELKVHNVYSKYMPTQPEFLQLYKKYSPNDKKEQTFCFVCNNRGYDIGIEKIIIGDIEMEYSYALHCDFCEKGEKEKIRSGKYYSEPISAYYDIDKLIKKNKALYQKKLKAKESNEKIEQNKKIVRTLLSQLT